jgi:DNA-binding CsgD family transcriptional regulator/tetratricopeptide (TPR) repeat protein
VADSTPSSQRYRLLETIRQYAHLKLVEAGEASRIRDNHLDYYLHWVEMNAPHLSGPGQPAWLDSFAAEHDNIRLALEWSLTSPGRIELGLRLAAACGRFWRLHGDFREARERLNTLLRLSDPHERTNARAWALLWSANLAYLQSDYPAVAALAQEGLEICRQLGPAGQPGVAQALDLLGELATEIGDYQTASGLIAESLAIYRALNDRRGIAEMLMQLGWAAMRAGDYPRAELLINECLPMIQALGEAKLLGEVLSGMGELAVRQGKYDLARRLLEESLDLRRALGERWGVAASLGTLGWAALLQRDYPRMRETMGESLTTRIEIGERGGTAWCLEKLAESIVLQAQPLPNLHRLHALQRAVHVFAAASALRAPLQSVIDPIDQPEYERNLGELRNALGDKAFDAAWHQGEVLPLTEIVELALAPALTSVDAAALSDAQVSKAKYGGLTSQERKAAVLIAQGKTNREVAEAMNVQVKTVETYVTRVLNKLNFDSRVQIATWALKVGLLEEKSDG